MGNTSILKSTKKMLNIHEDNEDFDGQIIPIINSVFMTLNQLGVGPTNSLYIEGPDEVWDDFIPANREYEGVRTYVYLKVRLMFDPPQNSFLVDAIDRQTAEIEWRLQKRKELEEV